MRLPLTIKPMALPQPTGPRYRIALELLLIARQLARMPSTISTHVYEVRPRKDNRGVDLISDALPFGPAVVRRAKRSQQCNRLRKVLRLIAR